MSGTSLSSLALREVIEARRAGFDELLAKYAAKNPRLFGSVARGDAVEGSDIDIIVEMDPADGNLLMRASGLMEETRELYGRQDIDIGVPLTPPGISAVRHPHHAPALECPARR